METENFVNMYPKILDAVGLCKILFPIVIDSDSLKLIFFIQIRWNFFIDSDSLKIIEIRGNLFRFAEIDSNSLKL